MSDRNLIEADEIPEEYKSEYLKEGFAQEQLSFDNIGINLKSGILKAEFDVENGFTPEYDDRFHLHDITSYRALGQLVIYYNCKKLGLEKRKLGEVYQTSYEVENRRPIPHQENIAIEIENTYWTEKKNKTFQNYEFEVDEGSFTGSLGCCVMLGKE